jgi:DNA-binding transcriptional LysR family regulator
MDQISSIKLKELEIFLEVSRAKSIREVSRRLNLTPGQVSKVIQQLESKLGVKLYRRSVSGVLLTAEGSELLDIARDIAANSEKMKHLLAGHGKISFKKAIAIASTSFLNTYLVAPSASQLTDAKNSVSFRFLDLAPDQLVPVAFRGAFEAAVHYGKILWPATWISSHVGKSDWVLCGRFKHPLPKHPNIKQVLAYSFVIPTYWTQEGLVKGNDQFPVPLSKRKAGFETATADAAVPVLLETDQIAFLPRILVRELLAKRALREIICPEIEPVERDLFFSVRSDLVPDSMFKAMTAQLGKNLIKNVTPFRS